MSNKNKVLEKIIKCDEVLDGDVSYTYRLISSEGKNHASYRIPLYSVCVDMTSESGEITSASIKEAFCDVGQALVFYDKVVRNLATPIDLAYVFEDETR